MATKRQNFVTFESPGTLFSESTLQPIENFDPAEASHMASEIVERHGARPYGFFFSTRVVADDVPDGEGGLLKVESKEVWRSGKYFLDGMVFSYDEVLARKNEDDRILLSNMRGNDYAFIVIVQSTYRATQPFEEKDVAIDAMTGAITQRGDDGDRKTYRELFRAKMAML